MESYELQLKSTGYALVYEFRVKKTSAHPTEERVVTEVIASKTTANPNEIIPFMQNYLNRKEIVAALADLNATDNDVAHFGMSGSFMYSVLAPDGTLH